MKYLAAFKRIGWDVDETLIGSRHAHKIADYIRANPREQQHHIVTSRSHGMQGRVFRDLEACGLNRTHFVSLTNCPDHVYEAQGEPYHHWKGAVCATLGIEVLVDDDTENVASGCAAHGVQHIHPSHLFIDPELAARVRAAAEAPPARSFSSIADVQAWLDSL